MRPYFLLEIFPDYKDLLALSPEELGAALLDVIADVEQYSGFLLNNLEDQVFPHMHSGRQGYPSNVKSEVLFAIAEAVAWLEVQGLVMRNPSQSADWYMRTRRGKSVMARGELDTYRAGKTLPIGLLQPRLAEKVQPLYLRGEYDTAVFQAFREIEVVWGAGC
jgi:hypothetical protein